MRATLNKHPALPVCWLPHMPEEVSHRLVPTPPLCSLPPALPSLLLPQEPPRSLRCAGREAAGQEVTANSGFGRTSVTAKSLARAPATGAAPEAKATWLFPAAPQAGPPRCSRWVGGGVPTGVRRTQKMRRAGASGLQRSRMERQPGG